MAGVYFTTVYRLEVTDEELKIICLGLAGKLKQHGDIHKAWTLNIRLLKEQHHRIKEQEALITGALKRAYEEQPQEEVKDGA